MRLFRLLLFLLIIGPLGTLHAQDIHYSLYNMSPLTLNPALTGAFEGTVRIGGIYRDQWASFLRNQFVTPSFYADAPIIRGFGKRDWIGVGLVFVSDKAGTSALQNTSSQLSVAYHLALNKKGSTVLTIGLQGGSTQRSIDISSGNVTTGDRQGLLFPNEIDVSLGGGGLGAGENPDRDDDVNKSFFDLNAGVMLRSAINNQAALELGVSVGHVTSPAYSLLGSAGAGDNNNDVSRPSRITAHGRLDYGLTDKFSIAPTFLFQSTGGAREAALQGWGGYQLNKDVKLNLGLGYRFGDAAQILLGADINDLKVAASYDLNVSSLNDVSNFQGGFEIAAYYIIKIYKKPNVKPTVLCPKF